MSIKLLDCTLRDGGYINDWSFGEHTIRDILTKLIENALLKNLRFMQKTILQLIKKLQKKAKIIRFILIVQALLNIEQMLN